MGSHITTESVEIEVIPSKVDTLGYLFCGHCLGFGHGGTVEYSRSDLCASSNDDDNNCDGCSKPRADWPRMTQMVTCTVEHMPYKIF